ncbi:MAG: hypothetical protein ABI837_11265 [Acidobacteriota bacterium]
MTTDTHAIATDSPAIQLTNDTPAIQKRSRRWRVLRVLGLGLLLAVAVSIAGHFAWKSSGSNQWVKKIDKNGIQVWSRKAPGAMLTDIKALRRIKNTPTVAIASFMQESCEDFMPGCVAGYDVEPWNPRTLSSTGLWVVIYPLKMTPREYLLRTQIAQDPKSKAVSMRVTAHPDLVPRNKYCYRVEHVDNRWVFTPLGNGETEVEFTMHMDQGMPYLLMNLVSPRVTYKIMDELPAHFDKPQYQNAKLDYIKE